MEEKLARTDVDKDDMEENKTNLREVVNQEVLKLYTKYLDILDNQVSLEDVIVTTVITKNVTDVEEKLARREARGRLNRKKYKTQNNHGANGQFNLTIKRLQKYKMAAKVAAYKNWRIIESHWRENTIIRKDEKIEKCFLLKIHETMECCEQKINLHTTKYGNIVKIRNQNGKHSTCQKVDRKYTQFTDKKYHKCGHIHSSAKCWRRNKIDKKCGQPTDSSKKMKSFWTALLTGVRDCLWSECGK